MYGSQKSHYPWLKCHENEDKIDNDYVLRNDHWIKLTQPISMILVSFFSEDNVLSDEIKLCYIFKYQSFKKIEHSAFLGHPVYLGFETKSVFHQSQVLPTCFPLQWNFNNFDLHLAVIFFLKQIMEGDFVTKPCSSSLKEIDNYKFAFHSPKMSPLLR